MFSVESALRCGESLRDGEPQPPAGAATAQTLVEYDLTSAYGHAASRVWIPSGFCTGYQAVSSGSPPSSSSERLERLDKRARHRSFEFRAVYKFIDDLTRLQGVKVRSAYHNYSGLGIFTLGKYNLDLAVITEAPPVDDPNNIGRRRLRGRLILVNMDGRFVHGCTQCPSPPEGTWERFVNGQTHDQVVAKSAERDRHIRAWVQAFNAGMGWDDGLNAEYLVLHDCHTPGYRTQDLEHDFWTETPLREMVQGYQVTDRCGSWIDKDLFTWLATTYSKDSSFTFVAKATVRIRRGPGTAEEDDNDDDDDDAIDSEMLHRNQVIIILLLEDLFCSTSVRL